MISIGKSFYIFCNVTNLLRYHLHTLSPVSPFLSLPFSHFLLLSFSQPTTLSISSISIISLSSHFSKTSSTSMLYSFQKYRANDRLTFEKFKYRRAKIVMFWCDVTIFNYVRTLASASFLSSLLTIHGPTHWCPIDRPIASSDPLHRTYPQDKLSRLCMTWLSCRLYYRLPLVKGEAKLKYGRCGGGARRLLFFQVRLCTTGLRSLDLIIKLK